MLSVLEEIYDSVPRPGSRVEEHGELVLFVQAGGGHPYYARPRFPGGQPTVADVLTVRERQREIGVPVAFEWVHETTPDRHGLHRLGLGLRHAEQAVGALARKPTILRA